MDKMVGEDTLAGFYKDRKIFITGHTGFKGAWLTYILYNAGAIIKGYSLSPDTEPSLYSQIEKSIIVQSVIADINDSAKVEQEILEFQPDFIFHLAAQPLVRRSYTEPLNTFATNIMGTVHVLNSLIKLEKQCTVILITTDKVYENKEWPYPYRETDRLGGHDAYSASKAAAELVINSYVQSFFSASRFNEHKKALASARAGNVVGGGDWAPDRLIPDIIKSLSDNKKVSIRNPHAVRPWQHVLDPIFGYLQLGTFLSQDPLKYSGAWNFGPNNFDNLPVLNVAEKIIELWGSGQIKLLKDPNSPHEAGLLKLDISKAVNKLGWKPTFNIDTSIERTVKWYKSFYGKTSPAIDLLDADILYYNSLLAK